MGVFSKYLRYREAGEQANVNNVEEYGEPVKSLFTTAKVFTLHKHIDITDEQEQIVYTADTKNLLLDDGYYYVDRRWLRLCLHGYAGTGKESR